MAKISLFTLIAISILCSSCEKKEDPPKIERNIASGNPRSTQVVIKELDEAIAWLESNNASRPKETQAAMDTCKQKINENEDVSVLVNCMVSILDSPQSLNIPEVTSEPASAVKATQPVGNLSAEETHKACSEGCAVLSPGNGAENSACLKACTNP